MQPAVSAQVSQQVARCMIDAYGRLVSSRDPISSLVIRKRASYVCSFLFGQMRDGVVSECEFIDSSRKDNPQVSLLVLEVVISLVAFAIDVPLFGQPDVPYSVISFGTFILWSYLEAFEFISVKSVQPIPCGHPNDTVVVL